MIEYILGALFVAAVTFIIGYSIGHKRGFMFAHERFHSSLINQKEKSREHAHRSLVRKTKSATWI